MRGHAFIAEMHPDAFEEYAVGFALEHMQPLDDAAAARVSHGAHPDVLHIRPDGSTVKIDQVRGAIAEAAQKPYEGGRRVICIHSAGSMTQQAQNALLKSLEEPLECNTFLLLCRSAGQLLPTVLSRCALIRAGNAAEAAPTEDIAAIREAAFAALDRLQKGSSPSDTARQLPEDRQQMKQAVAAMMSYFSDAMRRSADYDKIYNIDYSGVIAYWQGRSPRRAAECADACRRAHSMLESNVSPKICASWLCISISEVLE